MLFLHLSKMSKNKKISDQDYHLRLILNWQCNLCCSYCHKEGLRKPVKERLDASDYVFIFTIFKELYSSSRVAVTGGEPLFRKNCLEIAKKLYEKGAKITLITNGTILKSKIQVIKLLNKLHVSVPTMDPRVYKEICKSDTYEKVIESIVEARKLRPDLTIKVNTVILNKVNTRKEDVLGLINFAHEHNLISCFIEKLTNRKDPEFLDIDEFEKNLYELGASLVEKHPFKTTLGFKSRSHVIELIRCFCPAALRSDNPAQFCNQNNKTLFIAPNGKLSMCMLEERFHDLSYAIKSRNMAVLKDEIKQAMSTRGYPCPAYKTLMSNTKTKHLCAGVIGYYNGRFLFVRNKKGEVILPKGHIEEGESFEKTAAREFREETGYVNFNLVGELSPLVYKRFNKNDSIDFFEIHVFVAKLSNLEIEDSKKDPLHENVWFEESEAEGVLSFDNLKPLVKEVKRIVLKSRRA